MTKRLAINPVFLQWQIETQYDNLNKKLDYLQLKQRRRSRTLHKNPQRQQPQFYHRVKNLTEIRYTKEEMKILKHGF